MNHTGRKGWWVLGGALLAALALLAIIYPKAKERWMTPLKFGSGLPSLTPDLSPAEGSNPVSSPLAGGKDNPTGAGNILQTPAPEAFTATVNPTEPPQPMCGGPPVMTILAVGSDNRDESYLYGLGDVIRIVRIDFVTPKVNVFSLPRDLWVEIPGISDHYGITHGKLNQAYFYGTPGMGYYQGLGGGAGLLADTLEVNFGLRVDHYGVVNMRTFVKIIDAVGGVDVNLPGDVDGRPSADFPFDLGYFSAGEHHLNGEQALNLARIRHNYSDFFRADNQNRMLCALKEKITTPAILPEIPQLIADLRESVNTDLSQQQLEQLACLAPKLKPENLLFTGLPQELLSSGQVYSPQQKDDTYIVDADPQAIQDYAGRFMAGSWPGKPDEPFCH